jgi:hypothetical protein
MKELIRVNKNIAAKRQLVVLKNIEQAFEEGKPERRWLLQQLSGLVNYSKNKILDSNTKPEERVKWSRILVSAATSCSYALRDTEIDHLKDEVATLEKLVNEITQEDK